MRPEEQVGDLKPFSEWMDNLGQFPADGWLVIQQGADDLLTDPGCWPRIVSSRDLTDDEYEQFDIWMTENGLELFLGQTQLEDIAANLKLQKPLFSRKELLQAVDYYWRNDAFLNFNQIPYND